MNAGNCNHRRYIPDLVDIVRSRTAVPSEVLTQLEPISDAIEAYKTFDQKKIGWVKVELVPQEGKQAAA